jgi:CRP/FNR family transcriptional regulator, cyclic AMP receptor protein
MVISEARPPASRSSFPYVCNLLHEFPPAVAAYLLRHAKPVVLRKGDVLFHRGDPGDACFFVRHGLLKVSIASADGEECIVALHGSGTIMGEIAMIDGLPRAVTARALSDCRLDAIGRDTFRACMREHPEMSAALIAILAGRLRRAGEEAAWANLLPARARVVRAMLYIARVAGSDGDPGWRTIAIPMTRADIAAMAGVSREEASRALSAWRKAGVLADKPGALLEVDVAALQAEVSDDAADTLGFRIRREALP